VQENSKSDFTDTKRTNSVLGKAKSISKISSVTSVHLTSASPSKKAATHTHITKEKLTPLPELLGHTLPAFDYSDIYDLRAPPKIRSKRTIREVDSDYEKAPLECSKKYRKTLVPKSPRPPADGLYSPDTWGTESSVDSLARNQIQSSQVSQIKPETVTLDDFEEQLDEFSNWLQGNVE